MQSGSMLTPYPLKQRLSTGVSWGIFVGMTTHKTVFDLSNRVLNGEKLGSDDVLPLLTQPDVPLLPLLMAAYEVRKATWGNRVAIHVINNAQNGYCPEDCHYCAQAKPSEAPIESYGMKSESEIIAEAQRAHDAGAFRYCMVFSGRGPSKTRVTQLANLIKKVKEAVPIQVCLSAGLINHDAAIELKEAGLDRLNHNLNTAEEQYSRICSTHTYADRLNTLHAAKSANLPICSGLIVGMGETPQDIVSVGLALRDNGAVSIPVNFLIPIQGTAFEAQQSLTPDYCLKVLCVMRLLNPTCELRAAAGRETHLRQLQALSLYPANSLFMDGYLNTTGLSPHLTIQMIQDAGFEVDSPFEMADLIAKWKSAAATTVTYKQIPDLHPTQTAPAVS